MSGRSRFPLDNSFDDLREVVDDVREALVAFKRDLGGGGGGTSGRAAGGATSGDAAAAFIPKAADSLKFSELLRNFRETVNGMRAFGSVAKALGFAEASKELEKNANRMKLLGELTAGVVAGAKFLKAGFAEVAAGVAIAVGAIISFDVAIDQATGTSSTLGEKGALAGLQIVEAFQKAKKTVELMYDSMESTDTELDANLDRNKAEIKATEDSITALEDKIAARTATAKPLALLDAIKAKVRADLAEMGAAFSGPVKLLLDTLDAAAATQERAPLIKFDDPKTLTAFEKFKENLTQIGDLTQGTFDFIISGTQQLSATISSALIDGFLDPQADIRSSFANLFKALAQQLTQLLIQALLVKAIAGIGGAFAGEVTPGDVSTFATDSFSNAASLGGFAAGGFVDGPVARPLPGLHPTDVVPARLAIGEHVDTVDTVRLYGREIFEGMRQKRVSVAAVRALAAGISVPAMSHHGRVGYAGGGFVGGGGFSVPARGGGGIRAELVADDRALERLHRGGHDGEMRSVRDHRDAWRGALGV